MVTISPTQEKSQLLNIKFGPQGENLWGSLGILNKTHQVEPDLMLH